MDLIEDRTEYLILNVFYMVAEYIIQVVLLLFTSKLGSTGPKRISRERYLLGRARTLLLSYWKYVLFRIKGKYKPNYDGSSKKLTIFSLSL